MIGGPISGNKIGQAVHHAATASAPRRGCTTPAQAGIYSQHSTRRARDALAFENTLREAYIDLGADATRRSASASAASR